MARFIGHKLTALRSFRVFLLAHGSVERGATALEYTLLIALIAMVVALAIIVLRGDISGIFQRTGSNVG